MEHRFFRADALKIGVFGPYHSGKSSFIQSIDPQARHTEARTVGGDSTTVAIDFGRTRIRGQRIFLFGTPGQERFDFVRREVMRGLDGALILIDAMAGWHPLHQGIHECMRENGVPVGFLVNAREGYRDNLGLQIPVEDTVVHTISALDPVSSRKALESFVEGILSSRPVPPR